jgi:hypothetical protein
MPCGGSAMVGVLGTEVGRASVFAGVDVGSWQLDLLPSQAAHRLCVFESLALTLEPHEVRVMQGFWCKGDSGQSSVVF